MRRQLSVRLLVVDDDAEFLASLGESLGQHGYQMQVASGGKQALAFLKHQRFDLLLTDIDMPGMDGLALLKECLALDPQLMGVVMTDPGTVRTAAAAVELGGFCYIIKPFEPAIILPILTRALELRQLRLANRVRSHVGTEQMEARAEIESLARFPQENPSPVLRVDAEGVILYANAASAPFLRSWRCGKGDRIPDHLRALLYQATAYSQRQELEVEIEGRFFSVVLTPVSAGYVNLYGTDITAYRQVEKELRQHREHLEDLIEKRTAELLATDEELQNLAALVRHTSELVSLATLDGKLAFLNRAGAKMLGVSPDRLGCTNLIETVPSGLRTYLEREVLPRVMAEGIWEGDLQYRNLVTGHLTDVYAMIFLIKDEVSSRRRFIANVSLDITARKQAEEALKRSTEELDRFFEVTLDLLCILDPNGNFRWISNAWEKTLGYAREEIMSVPFMALVHPQDLELTRAAMADLSTERAVKGYVNRYCCKDGSYRWFEWNVAQAGSLVYAAARDITQHEELEAALIAAKEEAERANKYKSRFLASMSHEIRTPMNAILGFSQLMLNDPNLSDRQRQYLNTINRSGEHLLRLINDILEMSKIESGRMSLDLAPLDLHAVIDEVDSMFRLRIEAKGLQFVVERTSDLPNHIVADEAKIRQVVINLLGNAFKFTERGSIAVRSRVLQEKSEDLMLRIDVEDSGPGIAREEQGLLFKPFEQTRTGRANRSGTGLGLAISQQYARLLGGDIIFQSQVGVGSCFSFQFMAKACDSAGAVGRERPSGLFRVTSILPDQQSRKVLVVDDQDDNRLLLREMLEGSGFLIKEAPNGREALQVFADWQPQLILMDMRMPLMDGRETIRQLRGMDGGKEVKIISVTASAFADDRMEALAVGADDFVSKPVRQGVLLEKIKALVRLEYVCSSSDKIEQKAEQTADQTVACSLTGLNLPPTLIQELHDATLTADRDRLLELIDQVEVHDPRVARSLRRLAEQFSYHELLEAFQVDKELA